MNDLTWLTHDPSVTWDPTSDEAKMDPYCPPKKPVLARCDHCRMTYKTDRMIWGTKAGMRSIAPLWWCPTDGCDGAGYGFDVHKVEMHS